MRITAVFFLLIALTTIVSVEAGSYFSSKQNGLGIRQYHTSVRGIAMGGTGIATFDSLSLNFQSVSHLRFINNTRTSIGLQYQRFNLATQNQNFLFSTTKFSGINLAIPLKEKKWVLGGSLKPYTEIDFKTNQSLTQDGVRFTQISQFEGIISKAKLNFIWSPTRSLGLAVHGNYYFGTLEDNFNFLFNNDDYFDSSHNVQYRISGPGIGLSFDYTPIRQVMLAGFVDFPPSLDLTVNYSSPVSQTGSSGERAFDTFPMHFGIGSAFKLDSRWTVAGDFSYQSWSNAFENEPADIEDWFHTGIGFERGLAKKRDAGFFDRLDWRGGVSITQLGYKFNQETVLEYGLHFGFGLPFGNYTNRIDLGLEAGLRGDESEHLAQEEFINLHLSISFGEKWFQKIR